jgi:hypothetical protein
VPTRPSPRPAPGDTANTVSSPGHAGHALLFRDHIVVKKDFKVGGGSGGAAHPRTRRACAGCSLRARPRSAAPQRPWACAGALPGSPVAQAAAVGARGARALPSAARGAPLPCMRSAARRRAPSARTRPLSPHQDFPSTAMTFEAWVSSSDYCHAGGCPCAPGVEGEQGV